MTLEAARVTLKLHRTEVGVSAAAAVVLGIAGVVVLAVLVEGMSVAVGAYIVGAMKVLPFALGLIGGIPIVSREIEGRTAQVAWSLNASRIRWLARQVVPIGVLLGVAIAFPAFVTAAVAGDRAVAAEQAFQDIGAVGLPAMARALAAFGLGLFFGAMIGRALPALIAGALAVLLLFTVSTEWRSQWLRDQGPVVAIDDPSIAIQTEWAMRAPDGTQLALDEAIQFAPASEVEPTIWLEDNGYEWLPLGVPRDVAMGWALYEGGMFTTVGVVALAGTVALVNRRRPI